MKAEMKETLNTTPEDVTACVPRELTGESTHDLKTLKRRSGEGWSG